ncbi:MAG TPA: hypothetical protein VK504_13770 [Vicinamibacterales bacterium]|nr:hypothetical protein [Vicinamibacterales bacterium]
MTPVEAASVVRFGRIGGDFIAQRRFIAAGLVLAQEVERLEGECDELRAELDRVNAELHEQYEAVHELHETFAEARDAFAEAFPDIEAQMGERPRMGRLP